MKKRLGLMLSLMTVLVFTACSMGSEAPESTAEEPMSAESPQEAPGESLGDAEAAPMSPSAEGEEKSSKAYTVAELFPFEKDVYSLYEGMGIEYAGYTEYVDFLSEERIQLRRNNGGTEMVVVLEKKDGELREILLHPEIYFKENFLGKEPEGDRLLLKEPLVLGATWTSLGDSVEVTGVEVPVETPLGTFPSLEVTRKVASGNDHAVIKDYYSPAMGLVKTIHVGEGYEVTATLKERTVNTPQKKIVNFYYPNAVDERIFLYRKELTFTTNDIPRHTLINAYKELPTKAAPVLTTNTKVNWLYLNEDGRVYVDLSRDFVEEMNAGSGYEALILQSLANTIGDYYGVSQVMLTIDGETYESGHILLGKFEPLKVNYDSIVDMN